MRRLARTILALLASTSGVAAAQSPEPPAAGAAASPERATAEAPASSVTRERSELDDAPAQHRSGFSFGFSGGLTLGSVRGYPNDVAKIGQREFEVSTGAAFSTGGALWLGGALADWLTLNIGVLGGGFGGNDLSANGGSILFRIEAFPLFYRGGEFRDLGILFSAGTGGYEVERDGESVAEGAGTSVVGAGVFYEPWRFWRFATGPAIEYAHHFSRSLTAHTLVVGWRTAFYAGP